ncbi:MAG: DUF805 domain-containing protein [Clostridium sp.]|nr:DUF805 domain-containing protein [Clostridium sp.]
MFQRQLTFTEAVTRALTVNYCNFEGRSSRSEYWWFCLFSFIVSFVLNILMAIFGFGETATSLVSGLVSLALLLPGLGLCVRRLHDINRSGWFVLLSLIPLVGAIILIVWYCKESDPTPNQYGPVPNVE